DLDPENVEAHLYLGDIHAEQGRKDEARESYHKALALDPSNERANQGIAHLGS
ncbi:unnamed protein product, partial [marine sediment metagenome]